MRISYFLKNQRILTKMIILLSTLFVVAVVWVYILVLSIFKIRNIIFGT